MSISQSTVRSFIQKANMHITINKPSPMCWWQQHAVGTLSETTMLVRVFEVG